MCPSLPYFTFRCCATWSQVGRLAFPRTCTRAGCQTSLGGRALRAGEWALNLSHCPFLILSPPQVFNSSRRLPNQLRLNGSGPVNLPPADVQPSPSELHLHLHQLRRLVWIRQIFFANIFATFLLIWSCRYDSRIGNYENAIKLQGDNEVGVNMFSSYQVSKSCPRSSSRQRRTSQTCSSTAAKPRGPSPRLSSRLPSSPFFLIVKTPPSPSCKWCTRVRKHPNNLWYARWEQKSWESYPWWISTRSTTDNNNKPLDLRSAKFLGVVLM